MRAVLRCVQAALSRGTGTRRQVGARTRGILRLALILGCSNSCDCDSKGGARPAATDGGETAGHGNGGGGSDVTPPEGGGASGRDASGAGGIPCTDRTCLAPCPTGLPGPALVAVPTPDGASYCVDATEVTNAQYAVFLGSRVSTSEQPAACAWNESYEPSAEWPSGRGREDYPVVYVDWCDATAYCKWAGKRLCGKIGGGANADADWKNPAKSEWYNACSLGGLTKYPYGDTYDGARCVGSDYDGRPGYQPGSDVARAVASASGCHGDAWPTDGLLDLSGNVWEWENSCAGGTPGLPDTDVCRVRGSSFAFDRAILSCSYGGSAARNTTYEGGGIRCCSD